MLEKTKNRTTKSIQNLKLFTNKIKENHNEKNDKKLFNILKGEYKLTNTTNIGTFNNEKNGKYNMNKYSQTVLNKQKNRTPPPLNLSEFNDVIAFMRDLNCITRLNNKQKKEILRQESVITNLKIKKAYEKFAELWNTRSTTPNKEKFNRKVLRFIKAQANLNNAKYNINKLKAQATIIKSIRKKKSTNGAGVGN